MGHKYKLEASRIIIRYFKYRKKFIMYPNRSDRKCLLKCITTMYFNLVNEYNTLGNLNINAFKRNWGEIKNLPYPQGIKQMKSLVLSIMSEKTNLQR